MGKNNFEGKVKAVEVFLVLFKDRENFLKLCKWGVKQEVDVQLLLDGDCEIFIP